MLKLKKITEMYNLMVYTDGGDYFGDVEEAVLGDNKVFGWRIKSTKNSFLSKILGGAKGVVIPQQLVKSIGDVVIISKSAVPSYNPEEEEAGVQ